MCLWSLSGRGSWQAPNTSDKQEILDRGSRALEWKGVDVSEASVVGRFLRDVGDSLERVYIGFETDFVERGRASAG